MPLLTLILTNAKLHHPSGRAPEHGVSPVLLTLSKDGRSHVYLRHMKVLLYTVFKELAIAVVVATDVALDGDFLENTEREQRLVMALRNERCSFPQD